jgi:hypothetical protein
MRCYCCDREAPVARKVKLRPWRDFDLSLGGPESAAYLSHKEEMTFRWAAVCLECYRALDNGTGRASVGGREFNLAFASRGDKAAAESPATQAELTYWCLQHPAPGMQVRTVPETGTDRLAADETAGCLAVTWPYAPPPLGIGSTEEALATFSGEVADRHPPTGPTADEAGVERPARRACGC